MDLDLAESDLFPKYHRFGYMPDDGNECHTLASYAQSFYPDAATMPSHWHYRDYEYFQKKHGHLGNEIWSLTKSYHLLILNGHRVARFWTDTSVCRVDLSSNVAAVLARNGYDVNHKSRDPFQHRMIASSKGDIELIMATIKDVYR